MLAADHPCAAQPAVLVGALAEEVWLPPPDDAAPAWNQLVLRHCQEAGFRPRRCPGTTWGPAAAAELAVERRCVVPTNAWLTAPDGVVFRPLVDPEIRFPWSVTWAGEASEPVDALLAAARCVGRERGWSLPAAQPDRGDRSAE